MAGMFYSIQETAEKIGISEAEVKQLAKDGKLREFRDGENIMFKVDEVDNLHDQESSLRLDVMDDTDSVQVTEPSAEVESAHLDEDFSLEDSLVIQDSGEDAVEASAGNLDALMDLNLGEDTVASSIAESSAEAEPTVDLMHDDLDLAGIDEMENLALADDEPQIDLSDTQLVPAAPEATTQDPSLGDEDLFLSSGDTPKPTLDTFDTGLADDTAITGEGINVLGETDGDYKLTDDTMAETLAGLGATGEASLEEIEEDVNLDSFGSGSGLLDLSLQADDTSLGGILDEIYTSDEDDAPAPDTEHATSEAMTAEVDQLTVSDEMPEADMGVMAAPMAMAVSMAEIEPDASSNTLGLLLFIPMFLVIYTGIVALYAHNTEGMLVSVASAIKGILWIVMGGLLVVAIIWAAIGFSKGSSASKSGSKKAKAKKPKKEKKVKAPKAAKENKNKEAKPKKSLFGKKK